MMRFILLLISLFLLLSCAKRVMAPIVHTERVIDTITRIEPDSSIVRALFECDSLGRVRLRELDARKGSTASHEIDFKDSELRIETRWKTRYIDRVREVRDTIAVVDYRVKTKDVRFVPQFFWWTFAISILALAYIIWRIIRKFK